MLMVSMISMRAMSWPGLISPPGWMGSPDHASATPASSSCPRQFRTSAVESKLSLSHPGRTFHKYGVICLLGQVDNGGDFSGGNITDGIKPVLDIRHTAKHCFYIFFVVFVHNEDLVNHKIDKGQAYRCNIFTFPFHEPQDMYMYILNCGKEILIFSLHIYTFNPVLPNVTELPR